MTEASVQRKTLETDIRLTLTQNAEVQGLEGTSGIGFFDHMLHSFAVHGGFRIELRMRGDRQVDCHHSVEDTGIALGQAFARLFADKRGLARFGEQFVPMDEALAFCAVDLSGRPFLVFDAAFEPGMLGEYDKQMTEEFFRAFTFHFQITLHLRLLYGKNDHHKTEALFKAAAHAIKKAVAPVPAGGGILSAKGTL